MIEEQQIPQVQAPSTGKILMATVIAALIAAVILVVAVLPAEYGIDPLGTGKALGLTSLAKAQEQPAAAVAAAAPASASSTPASNETASIVPVLEPSPTGEAPRMKGAFIPQAKRYQVDSREIKLGPGEGMEIKYNMKKGAGLIYSWTTSAPVFFEFHGEPNVKPKGKEGTDYYESYDLHDKEPVDQANGTFVAPSSGLHGWFWENKSPNAVTLKLVSAGFYDWIFQNRNDKETALKTMDPDAMPGHPKVPDEVLH
jgi:hypothetical protein